jgi:hypothetical protein
MQSTRDHRSPLFISPAWEMGAMVHKTFNRISVTLEYKLECSNWLRYYPGQAKSKRRRHICKHETE